MAKKLLAILGSPRSGGLVSQMLQCACDAAEEAGWQVDQVFLYKTSLAWCTGCMTCRKTKKCVIQDDLTGIREKLIACDAVVLAAPAYFANVPAPVKNLFDRLSGTIMDDNHSSIPKGRLSHNQKYLLLTACNTPAPFDRLAGQSTGVLKAMREFCHISGMRQMGSVVLAGTRNKKALPESIRKKIRRKFEK